MKKIDFTHHRVRARKNLLNFIEEKVDKKVIEKIGKDPRAWIEELGIISSMIRRESLVAFRGVHRPPIGDPGFRELGNGAFLYDGPNKRSSGLWMKESTGLPGAGDQWTSYGLGHMATIKISNDFSTIPPERLVPEDFEPRSQLVGRNKGHGREAVTEGKREVRRFTVQGVGEPVTVYSKAPDTALGFFYASTKPSYRLTLLSDVQRTTSEEEMNMTLRLQEGGVRVPRVIGHYKGSVEEFLFVEEVKGKDPREHFSSHRPAIIRQDAEMLALMCRAGFRKSGFQDMDDKIFDGENLSLIDTEECRDLYQMLSPDYREMVLDPTNREELDKFRKLQRDIFTGTLKDAIYHYREDLTPTKADQRTYIETFFKVAGWKRPTRSEVNELTTFSVGYVTYDSWAAAMSDTD